jgi:hypothetical protein
MRGHGAPAVRVGLHHGPALERDGDYFGATVNLAAYPASPPAARCYKRLAVDPVCGMGVEPEHAPVD